MSSPTGPANSIVTRTASAPCSPTCSENRTRFPRLLLMEEPSMITMPWFRSSEKGSMNGESPRSNNAFVKNRA